MTPALPTISIDCRSRTLPQVLGSVRAALRGGKDMRIVLRNLGMLEGSISSLLLEIVSRVCRARIHVTLDDGSGFAAALLDIIGDTGYVRAKAS